MASKAFNKKRKMQDIADNMDFADRAKNPGRYLKESPAVGSSFVPPTYAEPTYKYKSWQTSINRPPTFSAIDLYDGDESPNLITSGEDIDEQGIKTFYAKLLLDYGNGITETVSSTNIIAVLRGREIYFGDTLDEEIVNSALTGNKLRREGEHFDEDIIRQFGLPLTFDDCMGMVGTFNTEDIEEALYYADEMGDVELGRKILDAYGLSDKQAFMMFYPKGKRDNTITEGFANFLTTITDTHKAACFVDEDLPNMKAKINETIREYRGLSNTALNGYEIFDEVITRMFACGAERTDNNRDKIIEDVVRDFSAGISVSTRPALTTQSDPTDSNTP
jgi:hypothetical protein